MGFPRKVLVACNDIEIRKTLTEILERASLEPILAYDLDQTRAVLEKQSIALVFCEQAMLNGNLQSLVTALSAKKPPARLVLLLADDKQSTGETIGSNIFDAIPYPCRRSDLQWVIIQAMRDWERPRRRMEEPGIERMRVARGQ
jgi:DNA-binding NtrC family response regulator